MTMKLVPKMGKKPVYETPSRSVINLESGFAPKLLCDGPTFSLGDACVYSCSFCYVPSVMNKRLFMLKKNGDLPDDLKHAQVVLRRKDALEIMKNQLLLPLKKGEPFRQRRFPKSDTRVIYSSPLVDVAANMTLVDETVEACAMILEYTDWQIRLLSKSNLLPKIAQRLIDRPMDEISWPVTEQEVRARMIFGVSTGTLDDAMGHCFEQGTPLVSKRLQSLHWLQDNRFRTFGMICPSLPIPGHPSKYTEFADEAAKAIRVDKCEHVWAEVINVRGESMKLTAEALRNGGFDNYAKELERVSKCPVAWEAYSRKTFLAHRLFVPGDKLRFLQYQTAGNIDWWKPYEGEGGAVLLGKAAHG